jgi:phenylpropionate dioxygenase-like ring-hydroxylating dioxygenase large terminal subunit
MMGDVEAGRHSVAFPRAWWYPACRSSDLGARPVAVTLMDRPLVVFRDAGGAPAALLDRCPHRNYPLSLGRVTGAGTLECGYHGWRFDGGGDCVCVPGLAAGPAAPSGSRRVATHAATESEGMVWVWGEPDRAPTRSPFALPVVDGPGSGEVVFRRDLDGTMHAAVENALDVPHTAFLHRGIFRGGEARPITAVRRSLDDGVEVRYEGEPVGMGPVRLGPGGPTFDHWDRFFLPSVAQVEYAVEGWFRIVNTILHLPMSAFRTRAWFVVRFRSRLPAAVVRPVVLARGRRILAQDARVLAAQSERIRSLGGERFTSTDLDLFGNAVWHLLRRAERAERAEGAEGADEGGDGADEAGHDGAPTDRTVTFEA